MRTKIPVGGKKRRKKSSGEFKWTEGDPTCPAGWKIRIVHCADGHSVTFFLTPEGTTIKGRFSNQLSQIKSFSFDGKQVGLVVLLLRETLKEAQPCPELQVATIYIYYYK